MQENSKERCEMTDQEADQPRYRVVTSTLVKPLQDELNRLAADGYRFVAQIENKEGIKRPQPAFTVLVELSDEVVA